MWEQAKAALWPKSSAGHTAAMTLNREPRLVGETVAEGQLESCFRTQASHREGLNLRS